MKKDKVILTPEQKAELAITKRANLSLAVNKGLPALGILTAIAALLICLYLFVIGLGNNMCASIAPTIEYYNQHSQVSNPSVLRLIYMFVAIGGGVAILIISQKRQFNTLVGLILGFTAGLLLWQGIGECSWQFGLWEGIPTSRVLVNFAYIKGIPRSFLLVICVFTALYINRKGVLNWPLQIAVLTFIGIWALSWAVITLGALWPASLRYHNPYHWPAIIGILVGLHGALTILLQLFVLRKVPTEKSVYVRIVLFLLLAGLAGVGFGVKAPMGL